MVADSAWQRFVPDRDDQWAVVPTEARHGRDHVESSVGVDERTRGGTLEDRCDLGWLQAIVNVHGNEAAEEHPDVGLESLDPVLDHQAHALPGCEAGRGERVREARRVVEELAVRPYVAVTADRDAVSGAGYGRRQQ